MAKGSKKQKQSQIRKKAKRREKLRRWEQRYFAAQTRREEREAIEKIQRLAPNYPVEEILRPAA